MSEEWRRIEAFRGGVSSLRIQVTADAEIQITEPRGSLSSFDHIYQTLRLSAGGFLNLDLNFPYPFEVWLKSDDPNCQCQIQVEYIEEVTTPLLALDMRFLYGPMGLGIPIAVSGMPIDWALLGREISETAIRRPLSELAASIPKEQLKEEKPCPGITRLQAFKRELEEEKPKGKDVRKKNSGSA